MTKAVEASALQTQDDPEPSVVRNDAEINTDNLSPEAARRLKRFTSLVDKFERAASSGALSPPITASVSSG